ncbi:AGR281Cp [Eremothecium gossypii ATCC 10895]|uniref:AGR281Cp n=1 Tax=Eremothecium gossypii (strain ATCC 10895 / CBS 109.51 / FGSC 9923 / NRRL Y-1056) TaxID=284811 RepID=Q74ZB8_EREGS|nr:AGR281Cp [Eremothecium gossypii ATCC 10895]AAS54771.1 AGR281Cp [Eremothecium gossypii ATCC 10895]AEY99102.1 FAGR281Cp [Eremothecium gossypii FDAG1]
MFLRTVAACLVPCRAALRTAGAPRMLHRAHPLAIKKNRIPPRPKWTPEMEASIEEKFLHGGRGPGGQKINKCNSKVQLRHVPSGIVIECQATRSREQNRKLAREKLAAALAQPPGSASERELALRTWARQGKHAQARKSREKHERARAEREELARARDAEDAELLRQLLAKPPATS